MVNLTDTTRNTIEYIEKGGIPQMLPVAALSNALMELYYVLKAQPDHKPAPPAGKFSLSDLED